MTTEPKNTNAPILAQSVEELNLSPRGRKCLEKLNIVTIGALVRYSADDLMECKNFGSVSLDEIRAKLAARNLKLKGE